MDFCSYSVKSRLQFRVSKKHLDKMDSCRQASSSKSSNRQVAHFTVSATRARWPNMSPSHPKRALLGASIPWQMQTTAYMVSQEKGASDLTQSCLTRRSRKRLSCAFCGFDLFFPSVVCFLVIFPYSLTIQQGESTDSPHPNRFQRQKLAICHWAT